MIFKSGVNPGGVQPELMMGLIVADTVYAKHGRPEGCTVTSLNDGKHGEGSLHPLGFAGDLRTRYFEPAEAQEVRDELDKALGGGDNYDVVLESNHIHLEYQPKRTNG